MMTNLLGTATVNMYKRRAILDVSKRRDLRGLINQKSPFNPRSTGAQKYHLEPNLRLDLSTKAENWDKF